MIKKKVHNAKNNNLQARPSCKKLLTSSEPNALLRDIEHGKITDEEALKKITNIRNDIDTFLKLNSFTSNQSKMINILFMVDGVFAGISKVFEENNEGKLELFEEKNQTKKNKNLVNN